MLVVSPSYLPQQGPADELRAALPSLTELDLSDNLIASWHFVAELAGTLPGLLNLNLSRNRLALPGLGTANLAPAASWAGLQTLVLNSCGVTWPQAVAVARQLPILRELRLCGNRLATLALPAAGSSGSAGSGRAESSTAAAAAGLGGLFLERGAAAPSSSSSDSAGAASHTTLGTEQLLAASFPQLELLDLEENELSSWHADVAPLRGLPHLKALLLSCNRLEDVQYSGGELQYSVHAGLDGPPAGCLCCAGLPIPYHQFPCPRAPSHAPRTLQASHPCAPCCWEATACPAGRLWISWTHSQR